MINQSYRLQAFFANNWQDIEKFKDRDSAVRASKPFLEKSTFSEVRVLEVSFDKEKNEIVESFPIDLEYFLGELGSDGGGKKDDPAQSDSVEADDASEDEEVEEVVQVIQKSPAVATGKTKRTLIPELRMVLNMLSILLACVVIIMLIEHYETGSKYITKYVCQKTSFIDCNS